MSNTVQDPLFWPYVVLCCAYTVLGVGIYLRERRAHQHRRWAWLSVLLYVVAPLSIGTLLLLGTFSPGPELRLLLLVPVALFGAVWLYRHWIIRLVRTGFASAVEQVGDGVAVFDEDGRLAEVNAAFEWMVGHRRAELIGKDLRDLDVPLSERFVNPDVWTTAQERCCQGNGKPANVDLTTWDSPRQTFELTLWPIIGPHQNTAGQVAMLRDVTAQREAVADLEALHDTALAIAGAGDLGATLKLIVDAARRLTEADAARIALLDRAGESYVVISEVDSQGNQNLTPTTRACCPLTREITSGGKARYVADVDGTRAMRSSRMSDRVQAFAGLPLIAHDRCLGILYVTYDHPYFFPPSDRRALESLSSHAAVAIANAQMLEETSRAATTDPLTGLPNHRYLMERLDAELARAKRHDHPLAVMMLDVDDFKLVNDAHGHTVGDDLLRLISRVLREELRASDIVGRYGGDEFLAILPETNGEEAARASERLTQAIRGQEFRVSRHSQETNPGGKTGDEATGVAIPLHVSVGVAAYPGDAKTRLELISLADAAMYAAKRAGSDGAVLAEMTSSGFLAAQNATFGVLEGLVNSVDAKDRYTRLHSEQVAQYALSLGAELGLSDEITRTLRIAGLLHDVGKIGIPDHILKKPGGLDQEERSAIQQHPVLGEMIIREVPQLAEVLDAVRYHHERYDGTGYPTGLKGEQIPYVARLIAIADAYSAMTLDRPYRRALTVKEAVAELRKGAGTQFDPALVEAFVNVVERASAAVG